MAWKAKCPKCDKRIRQKEYPCQNCGKKKYALSTRYHAASGGKQGAFDPIFNTSYTLECPKCHDGPYDSMNCHHCGADVNVTAQAGRKKAIMVFGPILLIIALIILEECAGVPVYRLIPS